MIDINEELGIDKIILNKLVDKYVQVGNVDIVNKTIDIQFDTEGFKSDIVQLMGK